MIEYSGQTLYAFNKLVKLSFEKEKPYNPSLVARLRALISTLKYERESEADVIECIFKLGILLKRFKLFTSAHTDQ